ncbi:MAG: acetyl-CoA hydrolase/transferase C-terminal domain-containing protein [Pseudomonadota bacterium]
MTPLETAIRTLRDRFAGEARVYVPGCTGEPTELAEVFFRAPELAAGLTFLGVWIPGINRTDWGNIHPGGRAETLFMSRDYRAGFEDGRTAFLPLSYTQAYRWLETTALDAAFVMVCPIDASGRVSLGISADFGLAPLARSDVYKIAVINPAMPDPRSSARVPLSAFDMVCETGAPIIEMPQAPLPAAFEAIAGNIAGLIDDGDTLQFGLGNVQQAVLGALTGHKDLRIHSGMVSDPLLGLMDAGAIAAHPGAITTGIAAGTAPLYRRVARDPRLYFAPVSHTHAISTLSEIENFKAINSVIEVDLFGQANAEYIGGRQISGTGGLVDFLRGAAASPGGLPVAALVSTAKGGAISRIVPRLDANATSIARADLGVVVTEHGIADLRLKSIDARAEALIGIADPAFRDTLSRSWDEIRRAI